MDLRNVFPKDAFIGAMDDMHLPDLDHTRAFTLEQFIAGYPSSFELSGLSSSEPSPGNSYQSEFGLFNEYHSNRAGHSMTMGQKPFAQQFGLPFAQNDLFNGAAVDMQLPPGVAAVNNGIEFMGGFNGPVKSAPKAKAAGSREKNHECTFEGCSSKFSTDKDRKRHEIVHEKVVNADGKPCPETGWVCAHNCKKHHDLHVYNRVDNFKRHMRNKHSLRSADYNADEYWHKQGDLV